ncbi:hypothetical protein DSLASN_05550 [Desulfoluna limicola]|uniref:Uncharacterized protein n=1 Tax=Desulfoluna limicola TaxID=2810562 RepID=A0ABM7PB86_9BACT|nr:hypothetical protein [Desulfoluna limicola]BCS94923.1 hypothetical protein DSLASN_05550 [Desulfoluna limicola]
MTLMTGNMKYPLLLMIFLAFLLVLCGNSFGGPLIVLNQTVDINEPIKIAIILPAKSDKIKKCNIYFDGTKKKEIELTNNSEFNQILFNTENPGDYNVLMVLSDDNGKPVSHHCAKVKVLGSRLKTALTPPIIALLFGVMGFVVRGFYSNIILKLKLSKELYRKISNHIKLLENMIVNNTRSIDESELVSLKDNFKYHDLTNYDSKKSILIELIELVRDWNNSFIDNEDAMSKLKLIIEKTERIKPRFFDYLSASN